MKKIIEVNTYMQKLDRWWRLNDIVQSPYFNVSRQSQIYEDYQGLRDWLKKEADRLWTAGINVY